MIVWFLEMLAIGLSSVFLGWCLGNGHGYDEGYKLGYHEGEFDAAYPRKEGEK